MNHSFNGFPVATSMDFSALLQALGNSPAGTPPPPPFDQFLASHPAAKTFFTTQKPAPESFATTAFFGVNAFFFIDAAGRSRPVRYRFMPEAGEHYLAEAMLRSKSPTYLVEQITTRVTTGPIGFTWLAQIGEAGDRVDDPSVAWPDDRRMVKLGLITIGRAGPNTPDADRSLAFLPGTLPPGISIADPMVSIPTLPIRCPSMNANRLITMVLLAAAPAAAASPEESVSPLVQQVLPSLSGKQFTAAVVTFPPGAQATPHRHGSAFLYAYVLEGTVRSQLEGQPVRTFHVGEGWTELPDAHHLLTENASDVAPARLLVTFVSNEGEPLKTPDRR